MNETQERNKRIVAKLMEGQKPHTAEELLKSRERKHLSNELYAFRDLLSAPDYDPVCKSDLIQTSPKS